MKGARCSLSPEGKEALKITGPGEGVITGESRDKRCWRIHWDGTSINSTELIHKDYIEVNYLEASNMKQDEETNYIKPLTVTLVVLVIALIGLVVAFGAVFIVNPGEQGLLYSSFGGLQNQTYGEGWHLKMPIFETATLMNIRVQKQEETATAATNDLQDVSTTVAVNFQIDATKLQDIYRRIGPSTGSTDYMQTEIINPIVQESVKAVTAKYRAEELIENRSAVKTDIENAIKSRLTNYSIIVLDVSITDFKFSDSFTQAIEAKVTAQQNALKEQNNLAVVEFQAQQKVEQAKGDAQSIEIINAELLKSPQYINYMMIQKWDGHMPLALGSGSLLSISNQSQ